MKNEHIASTPKDVFLHLFNIVTFYLSVVGFIMLYIQYINAQFPDALNYYYTAIADTVRVSTSILFIAVPAYLYTSWLLAKDLTANPEKRELRLRKWLVYFTLFISAITIIIDLMIFVYNFLNGELTVQFFLKVLVVLLVAGAVFGYYMWDLKRKAAKSKIPKILTVVVSVVVITSIIMGFFIVGTPAQQRARRFDDQRIQDLQILQGQVIDYWQKKNVLPVGLINLEDNITGFIAPKDPGSKQTYEYIVNGPLAFELCATFSRSDINDKLNKGSPYYAYPISAYQQNWNHDVGRACFSRTIDPELYKLNLNDKGVPGLAPVR